MPWNPSRAPGKARGWRGPAPTGTAPAPFHDHDLHPVLLDAVLREGAPRGLAVDEAAPDAGPQGAARDAALQERDQ
ncbi:hypothetical protein [Streptomyces canus]|uniref:hypothetical protein n=1 Tax=Streptomyces canus TaxID=58343 RepID=UPI002E359F71|nr:hypothetical protein [Streptomyces canus]